VLTSHASAQRLYFTTTSYGSSRSSSGVVVALWDTWSIAEEAARRWIADGSLKQGWVSRHSRESWLRLMWEVEQLSQQAEFGPYDIELGAAVMVEARMLRWLRWRRPHIRLSARVPVRHFMSTDCTGEHELTCAHTVVMRAGRHYARFTLPGGPDGLEFGVVQPGSWEHFITHFDVSGCDFGGHVGLLLDLDQGSLCAYANDKLFRILVSSGLRGGFCWAACVNWLQDGDERILIEPQQLAPPPPTSQDVMQAKERFGREIK
jgi:hypothetical protein